MMMIGTVDKKLLPLKYAVLVKYAAVKTTG